MKSSGKKARIREMLAAESGKTPHTDWARFKQQIRREVVSNEIPQLEIADQKTTSIMKWLPAIAAVIVAGVVLFSLREPAHEKTNNELLTQKSEAVVAPRTMQRGDVYRSGRREIHFLSGAAQFKAHDNRLFIEATNLKADFKLNQKTDLTIQHPLITVTVTGTQFVFDATASGGRIRLTQGSLRINLKNPTMPNPVLLTAPVLFEFADKTHHTKPIAQKKTALDKPLYRYELTNGEVLYAEQLATNEQIHRVQLLGGKEQVIAVGDIASVGPALSE